MDTFDITNYKAKKLRSLLITSTMAIMDYYYFKQSDSDRVNMAVVLYYTKRLRKFIKNNNINLEFLYYDYYFNEIIYTLFIHAREKHMDTAMFPRRCPVWFNSKDLTDKKYINKFLLNNADQVGIATNGYPYPVLDFIASRFNFLIGSIIAMCKN